MWDEIRFPFDPALGTPTACRCRIPMPRRQQQIEERYSSDASGTVTVTITNTTAGYQRQYKLGRWAAEHPPVVPDKPRTTARAAKTSERKNGGLGDERAARAAGPLPRL